MQKDAEVLRLLGLSVLNCQTVEVGLRFILTFITRDLNNVDYDAPYEWLKKVRMLGPLVGELKKGLIVGEDFAETLEQFIERRNVIIHHFFDYFDLDDNDSLKLAENFLTETLVMCWEVGTVLRAFAASQEKSLGIDVSSKLDDIRGRIIRDHYLDKIQNSLAKKAKE